MKEYYFLFTLFITLFSVSNSFAQTCPPTGFSNSSSLYFFYDSGTVLCGDRPTVISVGASTFTMTDCGDAYSVYALTAGTVLEDPNNFTADFGFGSCEYSNGTLTEETLSVEHVQAIFNTLRVYPNPVTTGNELQVKFQSSISATLNFYDVTGKLVQSQNTDNSQIAPVNLSRLQNGVYMLQIAGDNVSITRKVVIMR